MNENYVDLMETEQECCMNTYFPTIPFSIALIIARAMIVFVLMIVLFRLIGKREIGQFGIIDIAIVIIVSSISVSIIRLKDESIAASLAILLTVIIVNRFVKYFVLLYPQLEDVIEGVGTVLIRNGVIDYEALRDEYITEQDIMRLLREKDVYDLSIVERMVLENDGAITVKRVGSR